MTIYIFSMSEISERIASTCHFLGFSLLKGNSTLRKQIID
jgi:hypothetical protein